MYKFKEFDIKPTEKGFEGDKIRIERVLNCEITVKDFKIEPSKIEEFINNGSEKCLHLQILYKGELRIIFTSSSPLMHAIKQIPKDKFPFITTIIKDNQRFEFT